jgi:hypothetical protein
VARKIVTEYVKAFESRWGTRIREKVVSVEKGLLGLRERSLRCFSAVAKTEDASRSGVRFGFSGFGLGLSGRFGRKFGEKRIERSRGLRREFLDADNVGVWNFPAERFLRAALIEALFEENRTSGIRNKHSRSGKADIAGSIVDFYLAPEEG